MSGHSKWATIKRQKGVADAKRGALFTKLGNQIAIAARGGTDPSLNSVLAMAIEKAKAANMPMANIERSIQRVKDKSAAQLEEIMYEGYGPGGVAILVEVATDNKNRTAQEVKHILSLYGTALGGIGSVTWAFKKEITDLNKKIFERSDKEINSIYDQGKKWSLEYFEEIYKLLSQLWKAGRGDPR